ncbi:MAG: low molecular weight protein-tyrosine-phosphatase [Gemmatimonadota bacterium]
MPDNRVGVLFVCLGNICRSPLAESVFRHLVRDRGEEDRFEIDSAGTSGYHVGAPPDVRSVATARARGVEVTGAGRQMEPADLHRFDYVIVMDRQNLAKVEQLNERANGTARIHLLRDWDEEGGGGDVPDPYYGGATGFEDVHDMVERSCRALLDRLLAESAA